MKNIKFSNTTHKSADNIIAAIENRAQRQSRLYTMLFALIVLVVGAYVLNSLSVREYDGYISHKNIKMRAVATMAIVDYYVKPGDIVNEGDTLYSQLMIDWLEDQVNPFSDNIAIEKSRESDLRIDKYSSEIIAVNNTIRSLKSAISDIEKEIRSGVKTGDELVGLNLELAERVERAEHLKRAISAEYDMQSKYNYSISNNSSLITQGLTKRRANLKQYGRALRHRVAYVDSKIINIKAATGMITLEHEEVLTFKPIGHPNMTDNHVKMIVNASDYEDIYEGMEVEVYAGDEFLGEARVSILGTRMAEAYAQIESILDEATDFNGKLLVRLDFEDGYEMPDKYTIDNYPVKIRYYAWEDRLNKR